MAGHVTSHHVCDVSSWAHISTSPSSVIAIFIANFRTSTVLDAALYTAFEMANTVSGGTLNQLHSRVKRS